jgi:hypothetical protein
MRICTTHHFPTQKHWHAVRNNRQEPDKGLNVQMQDRLEAAPVADYYFHGVKMELQYSILASIEQIVY